MFKKFVSKNQRKRYHQEALSALKAASEGHTGGQSPLDFWRGEAVLLAGYLVRLCLEVKRLLGVKAALEYELAESRLDLAGVREEFRDYQAGIEERTNALEGRIAELEGLASALSSDREDYKRHSESLKSELETAQARNRPGLFRLMYMQGDTTYKYVVQAVSFEEAERILKASKFADSWPGGYQLIRLGWTMEEVMFLSKFDTQVGEGESQ